MALDAPILSIAIPTWNRSTTLDSFLDYLFENSKDFSEFIEIIISDNASTDKTNEVIEKHILCNTSQKVIHNRNDTNLGFYGNFKKCRELATGKYLWVLGDDDFVQEGVVDRLLTELKLNGDLAFIYLQNCLGRVGFSTHKTETFDVLKREGHNLGLISSVIFLNDKLNDERLYKNYNESAFIGFIFLLNSFVFSKQAAVITGNCLSIANDKPKGYNFFKVFICSMNDVVHYMNSNNYSKRIIKKFVESYFKNFIRKYYILYRAENKMNFGEFDSEQISMINSYLYTSYSGYIKFWLFFYPFMVLPSSLLRVFLFIKRKTLNLL